MSNLLSSVAQAIKAPAVDPAMQLAAGALGSLVHADAYIGEVYSLAFDEALVQVHDFHRMKIGGVPALSFLIATRIQPGVVFDPKEEDSSIILLRVLDQADLPNAQEALRVRVENAQRVSGEIGKTWDHKDVMDATTNQLLGYAGVRCRVLGTYYVSDVGEPGKPEYRLTFGSDISNYYPNRGLKVFKPKAAILKAIVNFRDPRNSNPEELRVSVGEVRYASSNRPFQQTSGVPVELSPVDLLGQKSALFGMTRTGKSNTTKIILKSIFALRWADKEPRRIGQVVFDPNGEYANDNAQDANGQNPTAIKNVWVWMLGGPMLPQSLGEKHRGKFCHPEHYQNLLRLSFTHASALLAKSGTVYVRTDSRSATRKFTREILSSIFPKHHLTEKRRPINGRTQTHLFSKSTKKVGEIDFILTR